jgi:hypothetical protein
MAGVDANLCCNSQNASKPPCGTGSASPPGADLFRINSFQPSRAITGFEQSQQATGIIATLAKPIIRSRGMLLEHATLVN